MNTTYSLPVFMRDETAYKAYVESAAAYIARQPRTIWKPIAIYGGLLTIGERFTDAESSAFYRAFFASGAARFTAPLVYPGCEEALSQLEDAIARQVYVIQRTQP